MTLARPFQTLVITILLLVAALGSAGLAAATHDRLLFELDGDVADAAAPAHPDWAGLFTPSGGLLPPPPPIIVASFSPDFGNPDGTYHAGSDKDIDDISTWQCASQANPQDKTDLLNSYGALAKKDGSFYLYFGLERATNNGNSFMGFWLLQNGASCSYPTGGTGNFTPGHVLGDLLVLSDFTGGGSVPSIKAFKWNPSFPDNLQLVLSQGDCSAAGANDPICARVNGAAVTTPWLPGSSASLPVNTFFEGGINLTHVYGTSSFPCFTQLMAETRSSQETTASLKDYTSAAFPACDARISIDPLVAFNTVGDPHEFTFFVEKKADGVSFVPAAGETVTASLSGVGSFVGSNVCVTGADGKCSVTIVANVVGTTTVSGAVDVVIQSTTLHRTTNGANGNSAPGVKTWVAAPSAPVTTPSSASITLGGSVADTVTVSGSLGPASGTVTFYICSPTQLDPNDGTCASGGALVGTTELAGGTGTSPPFEPTSAGIWCFRAQYSGDDTYAPSSEHAVTECLTVDPANVALTTISIPNLDGVVPGAGVADSASVLGLGGAFPAPTGAVSFFLCGPSEVTAEGCPTGGLSAGSGDLDGAGSAVSPIVTSTLALGQYCWRAQYAGDTNYLGSTHTNAESECFTVRAAVVVPTKSVRFPGDTGGSTSLDASAGDTVEFVIAIANNGNAAATNVLVHDVVPDHATFVSCSDGCATGGTGPGSTIDWTLPSIAGGATATVSFQVLLDSSFPEGTTVIPNIATVDSDQSDETPTNPVEVRVEAHPLLSLVKSVDAATAQPGDDLTYTLVARNDGDAPATGVLVRDTVPIFSTFVSCTDGCVTTGSGPGSLIEWDLGTLAAHSERSVAFTVNLDGEFTAGTTLIPNVATIVSDTTPETPSNPVETIVSAFVDLGILKSSDHELAVEGDLVTYTLVYFNHGDAVAPIAIVEEPIPAGTAFVSCDPACALVGDVAVWSVGPVPANTDPAGTLMLTVLVLDEHGCEVCNVATIATPDENGGEPTPSNEVCLVILPDIDDAGALGDALGLHLVVATLGIDETIGSTSVAQTGAGTIGDANVEETITVPGVFTVEAIRTTASGAVGAEEGADATAVSEIVGLNVMSGLVTASTVRSVASSSSDALSTSVSTAGSTIQDLVVGGKLVGDVAPGTKVPIPGFAGSYVEVGGRSPTTSTPAGSSGGEYAGAVTRTGLVVHFADLDPITPGAQPLTILVAQATGATTFPQLTLCGAQPDLGGAATGTILSALGVDVGGAASPPTGGDDGQELLSAATPDGVPDARAGASSTATSVVIGSDVQASSATGAGNVCVLEVAGVCTVSATFVRMVSTSSAGVGGASSSADGSVLAGLVVNGVEVRDDVAPNTPITIPGVGFVILNEQTEDAPSVGHTGLRVRAIHLVVTDGPLAGLEVIVAEAYSAATFT